MKYKKEYYTEYNYKYPLADKNFREILDFYLIRCPVPDRSWRGKVFSEYGFEQHKPFSDLKSAMMGSATSSLKENYYPCKKDELKEKLKLVESVSPPDEYCVFLKSDETRVMDSLYAAIRNAFAHGSFNVKTYGKTRIYFFVNYNKYRKAQIILQENTLLAWKRIIESGYVNLLKKT